MGSAGAKAMAVVRGEVDAYLHAGGQWEWDSAAPVGVAQAAGLHCSRIDGSPLLYNESHPYLPDLVICRPELSESILGAIAKHTTESAVSGRVAMAREYVNALLTHDATKVRFAADAGGSRTVSEPVTAAPSSATSSNKASNIAESWRYVNSRCVSGATAS